MHNPKSLRNSSDSDGDSPKTYKSTQYHDISFNFRLYDERGGVFVQDCDDDGETAAGGRLLHLLQVY